MAIVKDEEQQQGQGTSQALGQGMAGQPQPEELQPQQASSAPATIGASQPSQPSMPMPKQPKAGTGTFANLRSYLQAAQGGGQQRVAQAATQQVQKLGASAQKGTQQAQKTFGTQMEAGSLKGMETAAQEAKGIVGTVSGVTYQAPQLQTQYNTSKEALATATSNLDKANKQIEDFSKETKGPGGSFDPKRMALLKESATALQEQVNKAQAEFSPIEEQYKTQSQSQQYFNPEQTQRFAEIINAQYQGPASLQQAGLYEQAAQKARTAQEAAQKTQTALGREQLLKDVFGRNREYGRGASKLDALLLNTSQQGVKQLQEQAQPAAQAQEALQAAQNLSANEAAQRQASIEGIRSGARQEFTGARAAEEQAVEERLSQTVENWNQLPDYFKQVLRDREKGTLALTEQEAGLLGVQAGEGLYNLSPEELVQTNAAEKARLISKDELSRQLALQQLAGTDVSRELQKDLEFTDLEKAGTQTAEDAINKAGIRDVLAEQEKKFGEYTAGTTLTGEGFKKHKQTGDKYRAKLDANLSDVLKSMGYAGGASTGTAEGYTGSIKPEDLTQWTDSANFYSNLGGDIARGFGLSSSVGGKYAQDIANRLAVEDLQNKINQSLQTSGFFNRTAIGETEQTNLRKAALDQILADRIKLRG